MKILAIRGENLASLAARFEVELAQDPLDGFGVFAISGPTGAGKSTILDALCIALYGQTPRLRRGGQEAHGIPDGAQGETLGNHDPRHLLRRGAGAGFAEVDFRGSDGVTYRAKTQLRRARGSATGRIQDLERSLVVLPTQEALGGGKVETQTEINQRLGLDFEQFTRCVLLAQNEFAAFLRARVGDRAQLLETLSQTSHFADLSVRVFERARAERDRLRELDARTEASEPLAPEQRAELERRHAEAALALTEATARAEALTAALQHREREDELTARVISTEAEALRAEQDRAALAPLAAELDRTLRAQREAGPRWRQRAHAREDADAHTAALDAARKALKTETAEASRLVDAQLAHEREDAVARARDEARAREEDEAARLDTRLGVAEAERAQAAQALEKAEKERTRLAEELAALTRDQARLAEQDREAAAWWEKNPGARELPARIDELTPVLVDLEARLPQLEDAATQLRVREDALKLQRGRRETAERALSLAEPRWETLIERLELATKAVAADDPAELDRAADAAEARVRALEALTARARELEAVSAELEGLSTRIGALRADHAQLPRDVARAALEAAAGARQRAEDELRGAERLTDHAVEGLRATLVAGEPCPVCGATEHPHRRERKGSLEARLRRGLQTQREVVETARRAETEAREALQTLELRAARLDADRAHAEVEQTQRTALREELMRDLEAHPEAPGLVLTTLSTGLSARMQEAEAQARTGREAREAAAQRARTLTQVQALHAARRGQRDELTAQHDLVRDAELAHERAATQHRLLQDQQRNELARVAAILGEGWPDRWRADPPGVRLRLGRLAAEAAQRHKEATTRHATQAHKAGQIEGIQARRPALETEARTAAERAAETSARVAHLASARAALLDGRAVEDARREREDAAQGRAARLSVLRESTEDAQRRAGAARAVVDERAATTAAALHRRQEAEADLARWLETTLLAPDDSTLEQLLQRDEAWLTATETQLRAAEAASFRARERLAEVTVALQTHRAKQLTPLPPRETLVAELAVARQALDTAREAHITLGHTLAADDVQRERHAAQAEASVAQRARSARWDTLNALIGSSDGAKLRRLAQVRTLELVVRHANQHLEHLGRRYALAVVPDSLHLMITDRELFEQARPVNSLSGGETFLVALGLALGLASLSSERVHVETLFVDEGFGSLDARSMQLALGALERLRSQGRQVGLISHVGELADRLGCEVSVEPQGGGRSAVRVRART